MVPFENPLLDNLRIEPTPGATTLVIFGASGDLTRRKLLPALYSLSRGQRLPARFAVVGVARSATSDEQFRQQFHDSLKEFAKVDARSDEVVRSLQAQMYFVSGEMDDPGLYARLASRLKEIGSEGVLYYLAIPPGVYGTVVEGLEGAGLAAAPETGWRRLIVEKPFGTDLASAQQLNAQLHRHFTEDQIFRIDHYLGKETVQNLLVLRFANGMFEPIWNRRYIDHVQITAAERVGVEGRGVYYDGSGALRDMVPNHLFQLITLTAMEPPISFDANAVRDEQAKVLHAIQRFSAEDVLRRSVRGQYAGGTINGNRQRAYRNEDKVAPESNTETFVALELYIDNWRWADVPFYLRTGKLLPRRQTEVTIQFKRAPFILFRDTPVETLAPNRLVVHIQPDEGISLSFSAKIPGPQLRLGDVNMRFDYTDYFGERSATGYERLLYDAMLGDATLFQRADMVEAGWSVVQPIIDVWKALPPRRFPNYAAGTWGPAEAEELMARGGRQWRNGD